ncbi:hypothetical protein [Sphingobacterium faecale]|uniref:Bacteriocin-like protein n=1 Tax=Sphingobacterium faecale TaxID=2803775 RepID=A0ABS1R6Z1_9SPHI|nr:hypothetical protein [Sphingobacterium faecale]MBL1410472.1 hypothetical protein [Sphingobacterium faecale]
MKNLENKNLTVLDLEETIQLDGGVWNPNDGQGGDYGILSPGGCIPNPFDKILGRKLHMSF